MTERRKGETQSAGSYKGVGGLNIGYMEKITEH